MTPPTTRPASDQGATEEQPVLEAKARPHAIEPRVAFPHEVRAVRVRAEPERDHLRPTTRAARHRPSSGAPTGGRTRSSSVSTARMTRAPNAGHDRARENEKVRRAVDEQEAEVAPAVAEAGQLRLSPCGWYSIGTSRTSSRSFDARITISDANSMPVVLRSSLSIALAPQGAHAAVRIVNPGAEEEVQRPGEHRVPHVAVQPRHGPGMDVVHPVADDHLGSRFELCDETRNVTEVVGQVGVRHHDVAPARGGESGAIGASVAAARLVNHDARLRRPPAARCRPSSRCRPPPLHPRRRSLRAPRAPGERTPRCSPPRSGRGSRPTPGARPRAATIRTGRWLWVQTRSWKPVRGSRRPARPC